MSGTELNRVAVLSDIHGVLPALEAVFAEPEVAAAERSVWPKSCPTRRSRRSSEVDPSSADMTASVISSASASVGVIPTAGRHGASHGEAFNSSSIRARVPR